jgi:hypothetical protein
MIAGVLPALVLVLGACTSDAPTVPASIPAPAAAAPTLVVSRAAVDALRMAVADANTRVLPTLESSEPREALAASLAAADEAFASGDARALRATIEHSRAALAREREALDADSPVTADLDALSLMLDELESALPSELRTPLSQEAL